MQNSLLRPLLRPFSVATSIVTTLGRLGAGASVGPLGPRPAQTLVLYDFEACPFCRKVREALSILDLEVEIRPCPKGGTRFRIELAELAGKQQFPYLVDPGADVAMYESDDIVQHLFDRYGTGAAPLILRAPGLADVSSVVSGLVRLGRGSRVQSSVAPRERLELYSYEASPFCRIVRESLSSLEIRYLLHNVAKGSAGRDAFVMRSGKSMVPYLCDPNTGTELFESADIVAYLERTYGRTP